MVSVSATSNKQPATREKGHSRAVVLVAAGLFPGTWRSGRFLVG
jgi:hypothetical protein